MMGQAAPAWVETGVGDGGVQVRVPTTCPVGRAALSPYGAGLVFRLTDASNYHAVIPVSGNFIYRKVTAGVPTDSSPVALPSGWTGIRAVFSGTAIDVFATTSAITTANASWGSSLFNTTSSFNQTATKSGLLSLGGEARTAQFAAW